MMGLFVAQNKCRSNGNKKTTSKLKTKKDIKISLAAHYAKLGLTKNFGPWRNSCIS
jgi:hypothetical protein